jgi:hypothetical protein
MSTARLVAAAIALALLAPPDDEPPPPRRIHCRGACVLRFARNDGAAKPALPSVARPPAR